jgi:diguanylate cyclase (GGDEF)-like protein
MNDEGVRLVALAEAGRRLAAVRTLEQLHPLVAQLALDVLAATTSWITHLEGEHGVGRVLQRAGDQAAGSASTLVIPVVVGGRTWGEIGAGRRAALPGFDAAAVAAGDALAALVAAALTGIADREELHSLAYQDGLTGLGNRRTVDDRLEELFRPVVMPAPVAVMLCDVDRLKQVNDAHGHLAGDQLLCDIAALLAELAATFPNALAARIGGDEFCLLVEGATAERLEAATATLVAAAEQLPLSAGLSCGWAIAEQRPGGAASPTIASRALLRLADAAQYRAKRAGRELRRVEALVPGGADAAELGVLLVDQVLAELALVGDDVQQRLVVVASACGRALAASSWAVSESVHAGPVTIVEHDGTDRGGFGEGYPMQAGSAFPLDAYPATARALEGGSFHATMDVGDDAERAFLAANGYAEVIGAGIRQDPARAWLVEVVGDGCSLPLAPYRGILRALVELALRPSVHAVQLVGA